MSLFGQSLGWGKELEVGELLDGAPDVKLNALLLFDVHQLW